MSDELERLRHDRDVMTEGLAVCERALFAAEQARDRAEAEVHRLQAEDEAEPLTPVQVEAKMRQLVNALTRAQQALSRARDTEVDAEHGYRSAERAALLSDECPKVRRDGPSAAERDAWVADKIAALEFAYKVAKAKREAAKDHLDTLNTQAALVMALRRSVGQAYDMAGAR